MQTHYVLVDFENVHVKSLALLKGGQFHVRIFLGPKNTRLPTDLVLAMKDLGERADYIVLDAGGHNALDFHITYYLGRLSAMDPTASFYIISKDTGFDSLIKHMNKSGIDCARFVAIDELPFIDAKSAIAVAAAAPAARKKPTSKKKVEELTALVLANLSKRKAAAPRTEKTLRSTIKMLIGAQHSEQEISAVFDNLVKKNHVAVDGKRIVYQLPVDNPPA
jgi:hypothetical protein